MALFLSPIPWYEIWFPINLATVPSWALTFLWAIGVCWWFARPFKRHLLLHLGYFLMLLFPATILWSFVIVIEPTHLSPGSTYTVSPYEFDPMSLLGAIQVAIAQAIGLAAIFTVIVVTSAILFLANLELSSTSYRSTSDDAPPDEPD